MMIGNGFLHHGMWRCIQKHSDPKQNLVYKAYKLWSMCHSLSFKYTALNHRSIKPMPSHTICSLHYIKYTGIILSFLSFRSWIRSEENYLVDWRQNSPKLSQERYWNPLVIGLEGAPSALDWRILAHFLECHTQERPGKSFGPKLTPKSLSDDVAISPPIDFFSFLTQQIYLRDQHNPRGTWTPAYMHQKSIVNINPKSQLLLMRHLRWIHLLQSLHQQSATPKHQRKKN